MKIITKAIIGLFILATGMVGVRTVFADYKISHILPKTELLLGTDDETSIRAVEKDIVDMADCFAGDGFDTANESVDYENAYLVYVDANMLEQCPTNTKEVLEIAQQAEKVWIVPVVSNTNTVLVEVSKNTEGRWRAVAGSLYKNNENSDLYNLVQTLSKNDISGYDNILLFGGEPGIHYPVAVLTKQDEIIGAVSLEDDIIYGDNATSRSVESDNKMMLKQNKVYSLSEFSKISDKKAATEKADLTGGEGYEEQGDTLYGTILLYGIIGICFAFIICFCVFENRKKIEY